MMDNLGLGTLAGLTLGLLISLYAVTTGSAFFLAQSCSFTNQNIFRAINILYGTVIFLSMVLVSATD